MNLSKDFEKIKDLSKKELIEAITWMILGDGYLGNWQRTGIGTYFTVSHKESDHEYILYKMGILSKAKIGSKIIFDKRPGKEMVTLMTKNHPVMTKMAEHLYLPQRRKAPDEHAIKLLDVVGLAIWYQDDGYIKMSKGYPYVFITKTSFSELEMMAIAKRIVDRFGIIFRLQRHAKGFDLALRRKDNEKFFDIVRPYISECMKRKIDRF